jgi:galactitol-specific phosphotransferase system IIB component
VVVFRRHLKVQTSLALFNFTVLFASLVVVCTLGLRISTQISDGVHVYWKAMNLTPTSVQTAMNQTMGIIGNAHSVSANMVPISSTADAMLNNSTDAVNVSFAMAATSVMTDSRWRTASVPPWRNI